jgi:oxygen-independent coproporphyrinogen-3 oxidase
MAEFMFLGLRLSEGVTSDNFAREFGQSYTSIFASVTPELVSLELITYKCGIISLTPRGKLLSNRVFERFI